MARLSDGAIKLLAQMAGWTDDQAVTATAIALAESGGRTDARGDTTIQTDVWGPSIGLWQIRSEKRQRGTGGVRDELANLNPVTNARHAYQIYQEQGWYAWSVYDSRSGRPGRYREFLDRARNASIFDNDRSVVEEFISGAGDAVGDIIGGAGDVVANPLDAARDAVGILRQIAQAIGRGIRWISDQQNWIRIAEVGIGAALVIGGAVVIARPVVDAVAGSTVAGMARGAVRRGGR